ncbi:MAG: bis(5'-nucleosyl)-tetraphosphatase (symmetrical) YqeK [Lachnospiraceae bacterium]|nr:bis(5'-nucleosyl)-tetraphosphatase (symmetrical) YqeK [Lachnospiraceae bacterium]
MKEIDIAKLRREMDEVQKNSRLEHTIGVAYTAASLAMCYGADVEKALIAGYLHDCAKHLSGEELLKICKKNDIPVSETEAKNPSSLLHGKVGAFLAKEKYGVEDEEILSAVCYHTTGHPGMTLLEKIVFLSDYMEPGRDKAPNLPLIRELIFKDIDKALLKVLEDTLMHLKNSDKPVDAMTQKTYDYYMGI